MMIRNGTLSLGELKEETMSEHHPDGNTLAIHSVVVKESFRRHKLGTKMLKEYLKMVFLSNPKINSIRLLCKKNLIGFYESCEFKLLGLSQVHHGKDPWYDMILERR